MTREHGARTRCVVAVLGRGAWTRCSVMPGRGARSWRLGMGLSHVHGYGAPAPPVTTALRRGAWPRRLAAAHGAQTPRLSRPPGTGPHRGAHARGPPAPRSLPESPRRRRDRSAGHPLLPVAFSSCPRFFPPLFGPFSRGFLVLLPSPSASRGAAAPPAPPKPRQIPQPPLPKPPAAAKASETGATLAEIRDPFAAAFLHLLLLFVWAPFPPLSAGVSPRFGWVFLISRILQGLNGRKFSLSFHSGSNSVV